MLLSGKSVLVSCFSISFKSSILGDDSSVWVSSHVSISAGKHTNLNLSIQQPGVSGLISLLTEYISIVVMAKYGSCLIWHMWNICIRGVSACLRWSLRQLRYPGDLSQWSSGRSTRFTLPLHLWPASMATAGWWSVWNWRLAKLPQERGTVSCFLTLKKHY